jgi:diguanylate cyclase (GGDEF)-like protein/PAS domain S-box-containing protein
LERVQAEAKEIYRQYTDLYDFAPVSYFTLACDSTIRNVNQAGANLLGLEPSELVNRRLGLFVADASLTDFNAFLEKLLTGEGRGICELEFLKHENETLWARLKATCFEGGQESRAVMTDITAHKKAEEELRESEERFHSLYDNATIGIYRTTPDGRILLANPAAVRILGYDSFDELARLNLEKHDAERRSDRIKFHEIMKRDGGVTGLESIWPRKDGSHIYVRESATAIKDPKGNIIYYDGTFDDITEWKHAEENLRKREQEFKTLVENTPDVIVRFDRQYRHIYVNPIVEKEFGIPPGVLLGKTHRELGQPPEMAEWSEGLIRQVFETGQEVDFELTNSTPTGNKYYLSRGAPEFAEDGSVESVLFIHHDITERKQAEAILKDSELFIKGVLNSLTADIAVLDEQGTIISVNEAWVNFGRENDSPSPSGFVGENYLTACQAAIQQGDQTALQVDLGIRAVLDGSQSQFSIEYPLNVPKLFRWFTITVLPQRSPRQGVIVLHQDITKRKQMEKALRESEARNRALVEAMPDLMFVQNKASAFLDYHASDRKLLVYPPEAFLGRTFLDVFPPSLANEFQHKLDLAFQTRETQVHEYVMDLADGHHYYEARMNAYDEDRVLSIVRDITERKQEEDELHRTKDSLATVNMELQTLLAREKHLAHTDALTNINNRRYLFELAEHEFEIAVRYQQPLSVMMFDIDHFKEVNDSFGHAVGDQMLELVAQTACAELRSADVIGRYGGEEFVIVLPMTNAEQAHPLAERIRAGVEAIRVTTEKGDVAITLSIGIVEMVHGEEIDSAEDLIRRADKTMYAAKLGGRNRTEIGV